MRRVLVFFWLVGCADPITQTLVRFEADPDLEDRADAIRVRIFDQDGSQVYDQTPTLDFELSERKVPVSPMNGDASRRFRVVAELLEGGLPFATVRAETGFVEGEIREVWLRFDATCLPITCNSRESCRAGACGGDCVDPARRGSARPTPAYRCAEVDAGVDGGMDDVPIDIGPPCECECADDTCTEMGCVPTVPLTAISLGRAHACAIDSTGRVWCWGDNTHGEIGIGVPEMGEPPPVDVPTRIVDTEFEGEPVTHVSLGDGATGIRIRNGDIYTFGDDEYRKLGQGACCGDRGRFDVPNLLQPGWINIAYGADHACAIEEADQGFACWGRTDHGQGARDPVETMQLSGPRGNSYFTDWIALSAGTSHTCGIRSLDGGALFCWGEYGNGRLGVVDLTADQIAPVRVTSGSHTWVSVSAGHRHTCGINDLSELYCWGAHDVGQLGVDGGGDRLQPNRVGAPPSPLETGWSEVESGYEHTCGIHEGALWCWGSNLGGALGAPEIATTSNVPVQVGEGFEHVSAGDDFTCAIDPLGALYCWGRDDSGRLGLGRTGDRDVPARVCFSE